jgi:hypothetical protein
MYGHLTIMKIPWTVSAEKNRYMMRRKGKCGVKAQRGKKRLYTCI